MPSGNRSASARSRPSLPRSRGLPAVVDHDVLVAGVAHAGIDDGSSALEHRVGGHLRAAEAVPVVPAHGWPRREAVGRVSGACRPSRSVSVPFVVPCHVADLSCWPLERMQRQVRRWRARISSRYSDAPGGGAGSARPDRGHTIGVIVPSMRPPTGILSKSTAKCARVPLRWHPSAT